MMEHFETKNIFDEEKRKTTKQYLYMLAMATIILKGFACKTIKYFCLHFKYCTSLTTS